MLVYETQTLELEKGKPPAFGKRWCSLPPDPALLFSLVTASSHSLA